MRYFRPDLFAQRKGIHIKLEKSTHAELRGELFKYNLSMQDIFEEFARRVVDGDNQARGIIERFVTARLKQQLEGTFVKDTIKSRRDRPVDELDHDMLYDLIEEGTSRDETDR